MDTRLIAAQPSVCAGEAPKPLTGLTMLSAKELAEELGIGVSTLWAWVDCSGKHFIPEFPQPIRLGGNCTRWRAQDVADYLAGVMGGDHAD